nr:MAG TPA: hypothetical protein [Caudoviricetes sp.]
MKGCVDIKMNNEIVNIDNKIEELKAENKSIYKNIEEKRAIIRKNEDDICSLKLEREKLIYGQEPSCEHCRYNVILTFSEDGEHNRCGNVNAPCTCCHRSCEYFRPHNEITKLIAEHAKYSFSPDDIEAFKTLTGKDILELDNSKPDKIPNIKNLVECYIKTSGNWRE